MVVRLGREPRRLVAVDLAPDALGDGEHLFAQVFGLAGVPSGEAKAEAGVVNHQPLVGLGAGFGERFVEEIKEFLIARQFVPLVGEPVFVPLGGDRKGAFGDHRIDEKNQRHVHFFELRTEPRIILRVLLHAIEGKLHGVAQRHVVQLRAARRAGDAIDHADVLEKRLTEFRQRHGGGSWLAHAEVGGTVM